MGKREELVEIALSQKGYKEGPNNDTKYGAWYGLNYNPWCAMFVSWCADQIGILDKLIPKFAGCTTGFRKMTEMGITTKEHIVPQKGDLIFFDWDRSGDYDHVGIVTDANENSVWTVEGNHDDNVDTYVYPINASYIAGYARPKYEDKPSPEPHYEYKDYVYNYQVAWNKTYGAIYGYIDEDGYDGPQVEWSRTKVLLKRGMKNPLVGWCQDRLHYHKGYYLGKYGPNEHGVDNDFGSMTASAVGQFQRDNKEWFKKLYGKDLEDDEEIGHDTITILF